MRVTSVLGALPLALAIVQSAPEKKPEPTVFEPIAFFNQKCTYCHTRDGGSYVAASLAKYTDEALLDRLSEMTDEKARSPLADKDLEVLSSWFRSLGKQEPYIAWTALKDGTYTFEATKGAALTSNIGTLKLEKEKWSLTGVETGKSPTVTATKDRKKSTLKTSESSTTHSKRTKG